MTLSIIIHRLPILLILGETWTNPKVMLSKTKIKKNTYNLFKPIQLPLFLVSPNLLLSFKENKRSKHYYPLHYSIYIHTQLMKFPRWTNKCMMSNTNPRCYDAKIIMIIFPPPIFSHHLSPKLPSLYVHQTSPVHFISGKWAPSDVVLHPPFLIFDFYASSEALRPPSKRLSHTSKTNALNG